jgi:predicted metalloendopeptidase
VHRRKELDGKGRCGVWGIQIIKSEIPAIAGRMTDPDAPAQFRADTVRNIDPWYTAFEVQPGEKLSLAPADRVRIW